MAMAVRAAGAWLAAQSGLPQPVTSPATSDRSLARKQAAQLSFGGALKPQPRAGYEGAEVLGAGLPVRPEACHTVSG